MHLARQRPANDALRRLRRFDEAFEVDPRLHPHALEHVDEVLRGHVARSSGGIGTAAKATDR